MKTRDIFTEADLEAIRRATAEAEGRPSGEIVTYVVGRVDDHDEGRWKGATLGANCTIVCGVTIGEHAFIGAGAVVTGDVPDYALMLGVPARQTGWMSAHGERLSLPIEGQGEATCQHTGDRYVLTGRTVIRHSAAR